MSDDGPGVSKEKLPHLFQMFSDFSDQSTSGFGFGLAISKTMIESVDGTI